MAITTVSRFQSSDGKLFPTREAAETYERASVRVNALRTIFSDPRLTQTAPILAPDIFDKPDLILKLRNELTKALDYHNRFGKLRGTSRQKGSATIQ